MPQSEYEILEKLGSGTYGEVILVRQKQEKRKVLSLYTKIHKLLLYPCLEHCCFSICLYLLILKYFLILNIIVFLVCSQAD